MYQLELSEIFVALIQTKYKVIFAYSVQVCENKFQDAAL